jgi:hypothetical protein
MDKKMVNDDEQKAANDQKPLETPLASESTTKPVETTSPQVKQMIEKQTGDSSNTSQASSENNREHVVIESSPVSKADTSVVKVTPHPDRVLKESSATNDNKNSLASSQDNSTSIVTGQSTADSGSRDQGHEQVEVATQIVAPHPDNVQIAPKTEASNTKPPKEEGGDKTNINLSAGAKDDERTFLDIGASERSEAESDDAGIQDNNTAEASARIHHEMQAETEESKS